MASRDLRLLPKTHLHLHFTGSMRHLTLVELADTHGVRLPDALRTDWPPELSAADERGWFRFQRLYDIARSVLRTEDDVRRLVREAAEDDAADGSRWLEIQVDPSGYANRFHGITEFTDLVIAANRTRHPLDARTLARLAAQYVGRGVVGFGLSNDERRGTTSEFAPAFRIARNAGLLAAPHGGELCGPGTVRTCLDELGAGRVGHGVRSVEDPDLLKRIVDSEIALEVCPASNVSLGVYRSAEDVPLRELYEAGARIALGADDPLLFGSRLAEQYEAARTAHHFTDDELADLARASVLASTAPPETQQRLLADITTWLHSDQHEPSPAY
jgi:adenosine deaminase